MEEKSKILIIGGTGYIGKYIVEASVKLGHPTSILVRESTVSAKDKLIECFGNSGVAVLHGDLCNHERLVSAIKQVDMAISVVGDLSLLKDQITITAAIKETGNVKEAEGIPYTYVCNFCTARYFLSSFVQHTNATAFHLRRWKHTIF